MSKALVGSMDSLKALGLGSLPVAEGESMATVPAPPMKITLFKGACTVVSAEHGMLGVIAIANGLTGLGWCHLALSLLGLVLGVRQYESERSHGHWQTTNGITLTTVNKYMSLILSGLLLVSSGLLSVAGLPLLSVCAIAAAGTAYVCGVRRWAHERTVKLNSLLPAAEELNACLAVNKENALPVPSPWTKSMTNAWGTAVEWLTTLVTSPRAIARFANKKIGEKVKEIKAGGKWESMRCPNCCVAGQVWMVKKPGEQELDYLCSNCGITSKVKVIWEIMVDFVCQSQSCRRKQVSHLPLPDGVVNHAAVCVYCNASNTFKVKR